LIRLEAVDHTAIAKEQNTVMVTAGMFNAIIFFHGRLREWPTLRLKALASV